MAVYVHFYLAIISKTPCFNYIATDVSKLLLLRASAFIQVAAFYILYLLSNAKFEFLKRFESSNQAL